MIRHLPTFDLNMKTKLLVPRRLFNIINYVWFNYFLMGQSIYVSIMHSNNMIVIYFTYKYKFAVP